LLGVTLAQAARGSILRRKRRAEDEERFRPADAIAHVRAAAECGLGDLVADGLREIAGSLAELGLAEIVELIALVERLSRGHIAALPAEEIEGFDRFVVPEEVRADDLVRAAVRALEALAGSSRIEDARALLEVVELQVRLRAEEGKDIAAFAEADRPSGGRLVRVAHEGRIGLALDTLALEGSPLMQGAA